MIFKDEVYKNVDFVKVYRKANEILVTSNVIETFPFKMKQLIVEQTDIRMCKYSKAMSKYKIDIRTFGSESAVIQEYCGAYIIFYNQDEPDYRIRFSIMHEFGHYVLGHRMSLDVNDPIYHTQELEANCFAAQILMPEQVVRFAIKRGKCLSEDFLINSFGVSEIAAEKRLKTLALYESDWKKRKEKEYDDIIVEKYRRFIDKIAPINYKQFYDYDSEMDKQYERDNWLDTRSRWN